MYIEKYSLCKNIFNAPHAYLKLPCLPQVLQGHCPLVFFPKNWLLIEMLTKSVNCRCKDKKYCIYQYLLCDGYEQCIDGSDEDPKICNVCPKDKGWPWRISANKMRATFTCKHRYNTNHSICATPCDGIDDMCLDYADENGCKIPSFQKLVTHVTLAAISLWLGSLTFAVLWKQWCKKSKQNEQTDILQLEMSDGDEKSNYIYLRDSGLIGLVVQDFIIYIKNTENIIHNTC